MTPADPPDHVVFLHVPKTAGMSLYEALDREYPEAATYSVGTFAPEDVARFRDLPAAERAALRLVRGHVPYGIHDALPGRTAYITVLRDPVDRVRSYYDYARWLPEHYLHEAINRDDLSLRALLEARIPLMMNDGAVRLLSGVWGDVGFGETTDEMLALAVRRLRRFAVVGLTEHFDETLALLAATLGWASPGPPARTNVTPERAPLDPATVDAVRAVNRLDLALHDEARRLFAEQCAARGVGTVSLPARIRRWLGARPGPPSAR